jgi:dTDP-4-dehydrorhamnose reductase
MFHRETSRALCDSRQARFLREIESAVLDVHPAALVVRTNVFGWTPDAWEPGWVERLLDSLEAGRPVCCDAIRHATPLLATDFADVLVQAWQARLNGVYHIAGSERTSPARFVERLAREFGLTPPPGGLARSLVERPRGFGCGETSLRTTSIRHRLGLSLPNVADGLRRLFEQRGNGFRDRLNGRPTVPQEQAA